MTTIEVDLVRLVDQAGLLEALEASGVGCELLDDGDRLCVRATREDDAVGAFGSLLDAWITERQLPLIPVRLDDSHYWLRPPGD